MKYKKATRGYGGRHGPYGDLDLDGSPNKFDCNPNDPAKDDFFANLLGKVSGGRFGQSDEDYEVEKKTKAQWEEAKKEAKTQVQWKKARAIAKRTDPDYYKHLPEEIKSKKQLKRDAAVMKQVVTRESMGFDKAIKFISKRKFPKMPQFGSQALSKKTTALTNLAKGSVFFPFTQPTVKSPMGRTIQGRMPSMKRVMQNFGFRT